MTLFESLKMFPKIDLHIDYFGSIPKTTVENLTNDFLSEEIEDTIDQNSLKDYSDYKIYAPNNEDGFRLIGAFGGTKQ